MVRKVHDQHHELNETTGTRVVIDSFELQSTDGADDAIGRPMRAVKGRGPENQSRDFVG